jgi:hypothetical protein
MGSTIVTPGTVAQPIGLADPSRLLKHMGAVIDPAMLLRELLHNAFHAITAYSGGGVWFSVVERYGAPKLAVIDDGCGMTGHEVLTFIGNLASSNNTSGDRKGVGSKITGINVSPAGLEYVTWRGAGHDPVRAVLGCDAEGVVGFLPLQSGGVVEVLDPADLPEEIGTAGHGTMVVIHGADPRENTYESMIAAAGGGKTKGFTLWVNYRYDALPPGIDLGVFELKHKKADPLGSVTSDWYHRTKAVVGLTGVLDAVSSASGTYSGDGYQIRWYHVPDRKADRAFDHGDVCWNHHLVAVTLPDAELAGLREVYRFDHGNRADALLGQLGLTAIRSDMAVVIDVLDPAHLGISCDIARTGLYRNGAELDLSEWAREFSDNMPTDLHDRVVSAVNERSIDISEALRDFMAENPELFDDSLLASFSAAFGTQRAALARKSTGTSGTDAHSRAAGTAPATRAHRAGGTRSEMKLPDVPQCIEWTDVDEEFRHCFAQYDADNGLFLINKDCPHIDVVLNWHVSKRRDMKDHERESARQVVIECMTITALEAFVQARRYQALETNEAYHQNWDFATTPQGLTQAVLPSVMQRHAVSTKISKLIGPPRD